MCEIMSSFLFLILKKHFLKIEPIQEEKVQPPTATILEESNISYETTAATPVPQASYEEYFDEDTFDSEFDSDEEFGSKRGRKRKGKGSKVSI